MTIRQTAYFWVGTNATLFFVAVGVIAFEAGLAVWQALVAVLLGTSPFATAGPGSVGGVRAGLLTMTFTRAVFGPRGNLPHAAPAWVASVAFEAINCIFGVFALLALMAYVGWEHPGDAGKLLATLLVLGVSAVITVYGHATMVHLQRLFAVALTLARAGRPRRGPRRAAADLQPARRRHPGARGAAVRVAAAARRTSSCAFANGATPAAPMSARGPRWDRRQRSRQTGVRQ